MEKLNYNNVGFYLEYYDLLGYMIATGLYYEGGSAVLDLYGANQFLSQDEVRLLEKLREKTPESCEKIMLSKVLNVFLGEEDAFVRDFEDFGYNEDKVPVNYFFEKEIINRTEYKAFRKKDLAAFKTFLITLKENWGRINSGCACCKNCDNIRRITSKHSTSVHWQDWSDFCKSGYYTRYYRYVPDICLKEFAKDFDCKSIDEFLGVIDHNNR